MIFLKDVIVGLLISILFESVPIIERFYEYLRRRLYR